MAGIHSEDSETKRSTEVRHCPSFTGDARSLITHRIGSAVCLQRQREHYHKCHRCVFRGQSADWSPADLAASDSRANGTVRSRT